MWCPFLTSPFQSYKSLSLGTSAEDSKNFSTLLTLTGLSPYVSRYLLKSFLKNGPIPAPFCLFSSFSHYNFNNTNWKKLLWCAWDLNPQPQDGRHRQNHRAMAAAPYLSLNVFLYPARSKTRQYEHFSYKLADDWIWTRILWCRKRLLCQLCHNHKVLRLSTIFFDCLSLQMGYILLSIDRKLTLW